MKCYLACFAVLFPSICFSDLHPPQSGTTFSVSSGTAVTFNASTATITNLVGTTSGGNATAGSIREYVEALFTGVSFAATGDYKDGASLPLTAGDWDVTINATLANNGATVTDYIIGISSTTGNSSAGLVYGASKAEWVPGTGMTVSAGSIASFRVSLSTSKTYYAKISGSFSVATPLAYGIISARRR